MHTRAFVCVCVCNHSVDRRSINFNSRTKSANLRAAPIVSLEFSGSSVAKKYLIRFTRTIGCAECNVYKRYRIPADPEEDLFLHAGRAREPACFPHISNYPVSLFLFTPFVPAPVVTRRCIAIGARSFFRGILESITENLVTLSTFVRISSSHFSAPQLKRVTGGLTTILVFFARQCVVCTYSSFSDRFL